MLFFWVFSLEFPEFVRDGRHLQCIYGCVYLVWIGNCWSAFQKSDMLMTTYLFFHCILLWLCLLMIGILLFKYCLWNAYLWNNHFRNPLFLFAIHHLNLFSPYFSILICLCRKNSLLNPPKHNHYYYHHPIFILNLSLSLLYHLHYFLLFFLYLFIYFHFILY